MPWALGNDVTLVGHVEVDGKYAQSHERTVHRIRIWKGSRSLALAAVPDVTGEFDWSQRNRANTRLWT